MTRCSPRELGLERARFGELRLRRQHCEPLVRLRDVPRGVHVGEVLIADGRRRALVQDLRSLEARARVVGLQLRALDRRQALDLEVVARKLAQPQARERMLERAPALRDGEAVVGGLDARQRIAGRERVADVVEHGLDAPGDLGGQRHLLFMNSVPFTHEG